MSPEAPSGMLKNMHSRGANVIVESQYSPAIFNMQAIANAKMKGQTQSPSKSDAHGDMARTLAQLDIDGDGGVTKEEILAADEDGDGTLTAEELQRAIAKAKANKREKDKAEGEKEAWRRRMNGPVDLTGAIQLVEWLNGSSGRNAPYAPKPKQEEQACSIS